MLKAAIQYFIFIIFVYFLHFCLCSPGFFVDLRIAAIDCIAEVIKGTDFYDVCISCIHMYSTLIPSQLAINVGVTNVISIRTTV